MCYAGEMIYVDAGTVHAIGPGAMIVETQQNSDTTYRLYDYGRPRELHIEAGLLATKEHTHAGKVSLEPGFASQGMTRQNLVTSPYFVVDKFELKQPWQFRRPKDISRECMVHGGYAWMRRDRIGWRGAIDVRHGRIRGDPGQLAVISCCVRNGTLEFLCSSVPVETVPQPDTVLIEDADTCASLSKFLSRLQKNDHENFSPRSYDLSTQRFYPVILAGGSGTRFWPRSRRKLAKQVLALDGKQTMIQQTVDRLLPLASEKDFWIITNGFVTARSNASFPSSARTDCGGTRATQHGSSHRAGGIPADAPGPGRHDRNVSR